MLFLYKYDMHACRFLDHEYVISASVYAITPTLVTPCPRRLYRRTRDYFAFQWPLIDVCAMKQQ